MHLWIGESGFQVVIDYMWGGCRRSFSRCTHGKSLRLSVRRLDLFRPGKVPGRRSHFRQPCFVALR